MKTRKHGAHHDAPSEGGPNPPCERSLPISIGSPVLTPTAIGHARCPTSSRMTAAMAHRGRRALARRGPWRNACACGCSCARARPALAPPHGFSRIHGAPVSSRTSTAEAAASAANTTARGSPAASNRPPARTAWPRNGRPPRRALTVRPAMTPGERARDGGGSGGTISARLRVGWRPRSREPFCFSMVALSSFSSYLLPVALFSLSLYLFLFSSFLMSLSLVVLLSSLFRAVSSLFILLVLNCASCSLVLGAIFVVLSLHRRLCLALFSFSPPFSGAHGWPARRLERHSSRQTVSISRRSSLDLASNSSQS